MNSEAIFSVLIQKHSKPSTFFNYCFYSYLAKLQSLLSIVSDSKIHQLTSLHGCLCLHTLSGSHTQQSSVSSVVGTCKSILEFWNPDINLFVVFDNSSCLFITISS